MKRPKAFLRRSTNFWNGQGIFSESLRKFKTILKRSPNYWKVQGAFEKARLISCRNLMLDWGLFSEDFFDCFKKFGSDG